VIQALGFVLAAAFLFTSWLAGGRRRAEERARDRVLQAISEGAFTAREIIAASELPEDRVYRALGSLERDGLVEAHRWLPQRAYRLTSRGLRHLAP